jgi:hypothetical protein
MGLIQQDLSYLIHSVGWLSDRRRLYLMCIEHNIGINSDESFHDTVQTCLNNIRMFSTKLSLPVLGHLVDQAEIYLKEKRKYAQLSLKSPVLNNFVKGLGLLLDHIYLSKYLNLAYIPDSTGSDLIESNDLAFGKEVLQKFPLLKEDISGAARCLALECPTASVFHLMRLVEHAVQKLGKRLKVTIDVSNETWYQIVLHVGKAIDKMPSKTSAQQLTKQKYSAIASHLNMVRIATRNNVMHPNTSYTLKDAHEIFSATKILMHELSAIVK